MALQNVRALLWRGEDLGFGGGNTREVIIQSQVAASARPQIITQSFIGSYPLGKLLTSTDNLVVSGKNRILVNRSPRHWLTVSATMGTGTGGLPVQIPVPPLQCVFLPQNIYGSGAMILAGSLWPIPVPLTGATSAALPTTTPTTAMTFDLVLES